MRYGIGRGGGAGSFGRNTLCICRDIAKLEGEVCASDRDSVAGAQHVACTNTLTIDQCPYRALPAIAQQPGAIGLLQQRMAFRDLWVAVERDAIELRAAKRHRIVVHDKVTAFISAKLKAQPGFLEELLDEANKQTDAGACRGKTNHPAYRADLEGWEEKRDALKEQTAKKSTEESADCAIAPGLDTSGSEAIPKANKTANHHPGEPARDDAAAGAR